MSRQTNKSDPGRRHPVMGGEVESPTLVMSNSKRRQPLNLSSSPNSPETRRRNAATATTSDAVEKENRDWEYVDSKKEQKKNEIHPFFNIKKLESSRAARESISKIPVATSPQKITAVDPPDNKSQVIDAAQKRRKRTHNPQGQVLPIAAPVLARQNPVTDFETFVALWDGRRLPSWQGAAISDRLLESSFRRLAPDPKTAYVELINYHLATVENFGGIDTFYDSDKPDRLFQWSWHVWHRVILGICDNIKKCGDTLDQQNCWFSSAHLNKSDRSTARPKYNFQPGDVRMVDHPHNAYKDKFVYLADQRIKEVQEVVARLICAIVHGPPPPGRNQASHLCHNVPQICVNPAHIIWEAPADNLRRNWCVFAAAGFCPHTPKCVFTTKDGVYMPHRNHLHYKGGPICDCEAVDCWGVPSDISC